MCLAAVILYLGFPIEALDKTDSRHVIFHFSVTSELFQICESFHRGEIQVEPKRYFACLKEIKGRIYAEV